MNCRHELRQESAMAIHISKAEFLEQTRELLQKIATSGESAFVFDDGRLIAELKPYAPLPTTRMPELGCSPSGWLASIAVAERIRFIPVDMKLAVAAVQLPGNMHKDPADRIIVATARWLGAPLVTADQQLRAYSHVAM